MKPVGIEIEIEINSLELGRSNSNMDIHRHDNSANTLEADLELGKDEDVNDIALLEDSLQVKGLSRWFTFDSDMVQRNYENYSSSINQMPVLYLFIFFILQTLYYALAFGLPMSTLKRYPIDPFYKLALLGVIYNDLLFIAYIKHSNNCFSAYCLSCHVGCSCSFTGNQFGHSVLATKVSPTSVSSYTL